MGGGTEAFPDVGEHCSHDECRQLDFLPFRCDGCRKMFCLDHRTYKAHGCPGAEIKSRVVVVCDTCSSSIEKAPVAAGEEDEDDEGILRRHRESGGCDAIRKHKPRCPVRRCKEVLTFSNTSACKQCGSKVCLRHRFPADHDCKTAAAARIPARGGADCRGDKRRVPFAVAPPAPIRAY